MAVKRQSTTQKLFFDREFPLKILQIKDVRSVKDSVRLLMGKLPREIRVVFNTKERKSKKSLTEQTYDYFSNGFLSTMKDKLQESTFI